MHTTKLLVLEEEELFSQCGVHTAVGSTLRVEGNVDSIYQSNSSSAVWCAGPSLKYHLTCQMYVEDMQ